jgi:hypothetical protein
MEEDARILIDGPSGEAQAARRLAATGPFFYALFTLWTLQVIIRIKYSAVIY